MRPRLVDARAFVRASWSAGPSVTVDSAAGRAAYGDLFRTRVLEFVARVCTGLACRASGRPWPHVVNITSSHIVLALPPDVQLAVPPEALYGTVVDSVDLSRHMAEAMNAFLLEHARVPMRRMATRVQP